jgi:polysaccharide deacetylase 2 family uncharacterized protein YibQ
MARKPPSKRKGKGNTFDRYVIAGIVIALIAVCLSLWGPLRKFRVSEEKKPVAQTKQQEPQQKKTVPKGNKRTREEKKQAESLVAGSFEKTALIAIVIDDLGQDVKQAKEVFMLPGNITVAILPGLAQSKNVANLARQAGREVLLHMPMEPLKNHEKTQSPGTLSADMTPMAFLTTVSEDVESVPGAVGVNNHEGSALTENQEAMKFLMAELKTRNLFFLDSMTTAESVAYATAIEFGMKAARRDVFLDNEGDNPAYIRKQLDELVEIARKRGTAIGIGHPHRATLNELRTWLTDIASQGIEIVPVSRLMQ